MRWVFVVVVIGWSVLFVGTTWSQTAPASCEQQVQDQYQKLFADNLVPQATAPTWLAQFLAMVKQLRVRDNQYKLKQNQAELAEYNWLNAIADKRMESPAPPAAAPVN